MGNYMTMSVFITSMCQDTEFKLTDLLSSVIFLIQVPAVKDILMKIPATAWTVDLQ